MKERDKQDALIAVAVALVITALTLFPRPIIGALSSLASSHFLSVAASEDAPHGDGHSKTYALLPGQTLNLTNRDFHWVEIRADYPVQFLAGPCHNDYTVQWRCHFADEPADLFIRDLRVSPLFHQPKSNNITITVWEN